MKRLIISAVALLMGVGAFAQSDPAAKALLDKSAAKFKTYESAEVKFSMTMQNKAEGIEDGYEGVAYMKGNMYRVELMGVVNFFDGQYIYSYNPDIAEVSVKNPNDSEEELLQPNELFEIHNKGFVQKSAGSEGGLTKVDLIPTDDTKSFSKLTVWVSPSTNMIQKVISYGKDGNDVIVEIKSFAKPQTTLSDNLFKYSTEAYPDAELVDLR